LIEKEIRSDSCNGIGAVFCVIKYDTLTLSMQGNLINIYLISYRNIKADVVQYMYYTRVRFWYKKAPVKIMK